MEENNLPDQGIPEELLQEPFKPGVVALGKNGGDHPARSHLKSSPAAVIPCNPEVASGCLRTSCSRQDSGIRLTAGNHNTSRPACKGSGWHVRLVYSRLKSPSEHVSEGPLNRDVSDGSRPSGNGVYAAQDHLSDSGRRHHRRRRGVRSEIDRRPRRLAGGPREGGPEPVRIPQPGRHQMEGALRAAAGQPGAALREGLGFRRPLQPDRPPPRLSRHDDQGPGKDGGYPGLHPASRRL